MAMEFMVVNGLLAVIVVQWLALNAEDREHCCTRQSLESTVPLSFSGHLENSVSSSSWIALLPTPDSRKQRRQPLVCRCEPWLFSILQATKPCGSGSDLPNPQHSSTVSLGIRPRRWSSLPRRHTRGSRGAWSMGASSANTPRSAHARPAGPPASGGCHRSGPPLARGRGLGRQRRSSRAMNHAAAW